jgi:hypothetical protein
VGTSHTIFTKLMLTQQLFVKNSYIKLHVNKKMFIRWCHVTDGRMRGHGFHIRDFLLHKERRKRIYDLFVVCVRHTHTHTHPHTHTHTPTHTQTQSYRVWTSRNGCQGTLPYLNYILSKFKSSHTCPKICCIKTSLASSMEYITNQLKRLGA